VIASPGEPKELPTSKSSSRRLSPSGIFIYADSDLKFDQPQTEVVFDRESCVAGRLSQPGRRDLSTMLGATTVQSLQMSGRTLQSIPQIKRVEATDAGAAPETSTSPGSDNSWCRSPPSPRSDYELSRAS